MTKTVYLHKLCQTREDYRRTWDGKPKSGVGTELERLISKLGIGHTKSCDCAKSRNKINSWSIAEAREKRGEILGMLKQEWRKRHAVLPFPTPAARKLINMAIEKAFTKFFERVYVVNLDRRSDRWQEFQERLPADWPFAKPERFSAIDGKKCKHPPWWTQGGGAWGCYRSHLRIIEECMNRGVQSVLLLEDDALFPQDFAAKAREFLEHVPANWGMLYLGGQHLFANGHPPIKVNDWVFRPYNVNRTHAFALRGQTMMEVYKHLQARDWRQGHHIDHHLGRFHQRRKNPIYCPKEWLVGQAAGKSNISGKEPPDRFWKPAAVIAESVEQNTKPIAVVLGLHSSGSSCLAGVLWHLGLHLGDKLGGYYGNDPGRECGYENVGLMNLCEKIIPFPATDYAVVKRGQRWKMIANWINGLRKAARAKGVLAAAKYPMLCQLGPQVVNACGDDLRLIHIDRPLQESIASLIKRCPKRDANKLEAHQRWLRAGKVQTLEIVPPHQQITIQYHDLLADPAREVQRIIAFLEISPAQDKIDAAVASIDPAKRHIVMEPVNA